MLHALPLVSIQSTEVMGVFKMCEISYDTVRTTVLIIVVTVTVTECIDVLYHTRHS